MVKLSSKDIKSFYDSKYANILSKQTINKNKRLLKYLCFKKTDSIVDIGCGDGRLAHLIHDQINSYTGVDFSNAFIEIAKSNLLKLNISNACFLCEDIITFCKKNPNSFDKVFALDFTEHVYDEALIGIFSAVKDSLKMNGILYIHTPNGSYILEILKRVGIMKQFPQHIAIRNDEENVAILIKSGFTCINVRFISHYEKLLRILHFLSYFPIFGKYFNARLLIEAQLK